ncbi:MAG: hypothetical protein SFY67_14695 [Candidatus Melainabacteria bacterium]|nr:hypothetical protein [Candidatus Melainabacteria bacterium]
MKLSNKPLTKKEKVIYTVVAICLTVGLVGSLMPWNNPWINFMFRPGILYLLAIIWGFYLGLTYRHPEKEASAQELKNDQNKKVTKKKIVPNVKP